ncbi:NUDIX hydrolase [bacterium]|nr:NUDIX hydrolase [bacterium]
MEPRWFDWASRIQAIAQNGLAFSRNPYDIERFQALRQLAAEIMADGCNTSIRRIEDLFEQETGYATPKIDLRGAVFHGERLLFVRESLDGLWTLPGGFADIGESPAAGVEREILEESGFETRAVKLAAVVDRRVDPHSPPHPFHIWKLIFLCELTGGTARTSLETTEVGFFGEEEFPPLSLGRTTPRQLDLVFRHHREPGRPTDFD